MPLDPRNVPTTASAAAAQRIADLERRVAALERLNRTLTQAGAPTAPTTTETTDSSGTVRNTTATQPSGGSTIIDTTGSRAYFWTGSEWKSVALT
jgi:hypothetical protein